MRVATLCFLVKEDTTHHIEHICLAMKKRGFGVGRFNGVGGKVKVGEGIEEAAKREAWEEIHVKMYHLRPVAELTFLFPYHPDWDQVVHVFFCSEWAGIPQESEEMNPQWFPIDQIPYHTMWSDDPYWLPQVLEGRYVQGNFSFDTQDQLLSKNISIIS
jgi:8-oxo-dGTP pyrophosphatase MutT (NUDIX family)